MNKKRITYLDNNATTVAAVEVVEAMTAALSAQYANPSSIHHFAEYARGAVKEARLSLANLLGCRAAELIFTSGANQPPSSWRISRSTSSPE